MDERKMFEAWIDSREGSSLRSGFDGSLDYPLGNIMWEVWQAARRTTPDREAIKPEWLTCETRGPMLRNSLKHRLNELRAAATRCRNAYTKDFMGEPTKWIASVYDEAADVLERHLDLLKTAPNGEKK